MTKRRVVGRLVALHALVFALANVALYLLWWRRGGGDYWPMGAHLVWGAALVMHWANDLIQRTHRVK